MDFELGEMKLTIISGGTMRLDGGNMFGVVPKALWERKYPADERNRIDLDTNCLLIRTPDQNILIDTGYGSKANEKQRRNQGLEDGNPLFRSLASAGLEPTDIFTVILSHLHFDHVGGATLRDEDGELQPAFPLAFHYVNETEWEDANSNAPELAGAYFPDDFSPLEKNGLIKPAKDGDSPIPGITLIQTGGHTRGHQIVLIESDGKKAAFLADLCPLVGHLRTMWSMAYDQFPLHNRRIKPEILNRAVDEDWLIFFEHDAKTRHGRIRRDEKTEFALREELPA